MNLFSIRKVLKNDFTPSDKVISICLLKGLISVTFDAVIHTTNAFVSEIKLNVDSNPIFYNDTINMDHDNCIDMKKFHQMMGHFGVEKLQKTSNIY
jgi:hypothetical protein